jgi:hypothetical protein
VQHVGLRRCGIQRVTCWGLLQLVREGVQLTMDWDEDQLYETEGRAEEEAEQEGEEEDSD